MDFCDQVLGPTTSEMDAGLVARVDLMGTAIATALGTAGQNTEEFGDVRGKVQGVAVHGISNWEENFRSERLNGMVVLLERGALGLHRVEA